MQKKPTLIKKILVPTDGSTEALAAADYAVEMARAFGAEVTILHVVGVPRIPEYFLKAPESQMRQQLMEAGKAILSLTQKVFTDAGIPATTELREGRPGDVIVLTALQGKFDLIVMGSRGLDPSQSLLLGSVSDFVARHAPCPVLIVRGADATRGGDAGPAT
ncbi:MAG: universal stress protein [Sphingomonadaceae bacterium]